MQSAGRAHQATVAAAADEMSILENGAAAHDRALNAAAVGHVMENARAAA
jgi:hypothetical protein